MKRGVYECCCIDYTCIINLVCLFSMKKKTEKQLDKELMNHIILKRMPPQEARALVRACIEKRIYEKTRKLH